MSYTVLSHGSRYRGHCRKCHCHFECGILDVSDQDPYLLRGEEQEPENQGRPPLPIGTPYGGIPEPQVNLRYYAPCPECRTTTRVSLWNPDNVLIEDRILQLIATTPTFPTWLANLVNHGYGNSLEAKAIPRRYHYIHHRDRDIIYSENNLIRIINLARCLDLPPQVSPCPEPQPKPPVPDKRPPFLWEEHFKKVTNS